MLKQYTRTPITVEALEFQCNPASVVDMKMFGGSSIGPITKSTYPFSLPTLGVEVGGVRKTIKEGDFVLKSEDHVFTCDRASFFNDYIEGDVSEISDGYHTFSELYDHRCKLFAVLCNTYKDKSWKSLKHFDGTMYDNYFIVGINTTEGPFTYHYHIKEWDLFNVKEISNSPEHDGHTSKEITRLFSLLD